jgi:cell division protein FtsZ
MMGAKGVLINITGGYDMTLFEVDAAANRIRSEVDEDANIIFGSSVDEDMNGRIRVSVVATGIDAVVETVAEKPKLVAMGGSSGPAHAVSNNMIPQGQQPRGVPGAPVAPGAHRPAVPQNSQPSIAGPVRIGPMAGQPRRPAGMTPAAAAPAAPASGFAEAQTAYQEAPSADDMPASIGTVPAESSARAPAARAASAPPPVSAPSGGGFNLFRKATGLMRRNLGTEEAAPAAAPRPAAAPPAAAARPAPQAPADDMNGLDIPTFLRRQSN